MSGIAVEPYWDAFILCHDLTSKGKLGRQGVSSQEICGSRVSTMANVQSERRRGQHSSGEAQGGDKCPLSPPPARAI